MNQAAPLTRPELTLPDAEADWLRAVYEGAGCILEYGSGGSTVLAGEMPGKSVWSVESDADWAEGMRGWFKANPPKASVTICHADIGETRQWGFPKGDADWRKYPHYALSVWDRHGFRQPDVVLIDGRFRVACFLATLFRTTAPVTVLFDDYLSRPGYHVVEDFAERVETRGRMARFDLTPRSLKSDELLTFVEAMGVPS